MLCEHCQTPVEPGRMAQTIFDRDRRHIIVGRERRKIGPVPWRFLELLWRHFGKTVPYEVIEGVMWPGQPTAPESRRNQITALRQAFHGSRYRVAVLHGDGVRLEKAACVEDTFYPARNYRHIATGQFRAAN
jgi:hypothetical protein